MRPTPLVESLARLIERTYDMPAGLVELERFLVGDEGYARLVAGRRVRESVEHAAEGARLLLRRRRGEAGWAAALYLPDALVASLEEHDPRRGLGAHNVDGFLTLVEEVDHLLTFADVACRLGRDVSLLELEWHAGVSKALVAAHFVGRLSGRAQLDAEARAFVEHHVFHKADHADKEPALRERYRDADRLALAFVRSLGALRPRERLRRIRRFHRASHHQKMREFAASA